MEESSNPMVACDACGHMVPQSNMELHLARACQSQKRRSAADEDDEDEFRDTHQELQPNIHDLNSSVRSESSWAAASLDNIVNVVDEGEENEEAITAAGGGNNENWMDPGEWRCERCTLLNPSLLHSCAACEAPNPMIVRPADGTVRERLVVSDDDDDEDDDLLFPSSQNSGFAANPTVFPPELFGGALLGGLLGASSARAQGRPMGSSAFGGAVTGALGGAVLADLLRDDEQAAQMMRMQQRHRERRARERAEASASASGPASAPLLSIGAGVLEDADDDDNSNDTATPFLRASRSSNRSSGRASRRSRNRGEARGVDEFPFASAEADPVFEMLMHMLSRGGHMRIAGGIGGPNIEGMSYEQLLQAFGSGTENLAAEERHIRSLPTTVVQDPDSLHEEKKQCAICLEDFQTQETVKTMPCWHCFHAECLDKWLRTNGACPICKHRVDDSAGGGDDTD